MPHSNSNKPLYFIISGIILFVGLYVLAAAFYPGGSQTHPQQAGFSWRHNYWCNLFNETAVNGRYNAGRFIAIGGMIVLGATLALFWYVFPIFAPVQAGLRRFIQVNGLAAAATGVGIFWGPHDTMINIAGIFGAMATAGVMLAMWRLRWLRLWRMAFICLLLVGLNNFLYYTEHLYWLPLVQKITFACFLGWIAAVVCRLQKGNPVQTA